MFVFGSVVVLAVSLQVISSQGPPPDIPPQCRGPPPGVERPFDCCKVPPFFEPKEFEECGFKKPEEGQGPPRGPPDCSKQLCVLEKYNLAKDGDVDDEAVVAFMDKYGEENKVFKPTVDKAKERCVGKDLPGPPHVCKANKMMFCIMSTLFTECPVWEDNEGCATLKEHMDTCKPFFHKH